METEKEQEDLLVLLDELNSKRRKDKQRMKEKGLEVSEDEDAEDDDDGDEEDPFNNMMVFSQALRNAGDNRPSAADDDEDMDAAVFFGDADEIREL